MQNRLKSVSCGLVMGLLNMLISIVLPFVSRTITIYTLGTEYVGLGGLFTSILSVLSLSELGVGFAITSALYKPIAENNTDKVNAILKLYRDVYRIVGGIIIVISLCLLPFLKYLVASDVPQGIHLQSLFLIHVINTVISYWFYGYKKVLLTANQRYDIEVNIASISLLLQYILQIIVLISTKNYYAYVIVFPVATLFNNVLTNYVINRKYPQYKCVGNIGKEEMVSLYKNVSGAFCSKLGSTIYLSVDNIVISAFLGLTLLGQYSNYYYIITSLTAIFAVVHNSLRPAIGNCIATESVQKNWEYYKLIDFVYMSAVTVCCSCCLVLFQDFERLWVGETNLLSDKIVVLLVIYFYAGRLSAFLSLYQETAGIWWYGKFIPLISAIVNLGLNIVGVQIMGLPAILLSSIIASALVTLPGIVWIVFKYYFSEKQYLKEYIANLIGTVIKSTIVIIVLGFVFQYIEVDNWIRLFIKAGLCGILSLFMMLVLNLRNTSFKQVYHMFIIKLRKGKLG